MPNSNVISNLPALSKVSVDNIKQLQDFIASAKSDADKLKGLKIANDNDIAEVSANIKELKFILMSIFNFKKIYN
jgi:hypothetical protein